MQLGAAGGCWEGSGAEGIKFSLPSHRGPLSRAVISSNGEQVFERA